MPGPRPLAEICLRVAMENVHLITSLSNMPPEYINSILRAVKSPAQLRVLEENSDDSIYDESPDHWKRLIKKDFAMLSAQHNYVPKDPRSWHKIYDKYKSLRTKQDAAATEQLMQSFAAQKEKRDARQSTIISGQETRNLPLPKRKTSTHWSKSDTPRVKQTFIQKARKQVAAEATRFHLSTPTGKLPVAAGQIRRAPEAMLNEARIRNQPQPGMIRAPQKRLPPASDSERERKERESRLLQIKQTTATESAAPATVLSFSDDEDDNNDLRHHDNADQDDLFDLPKPKGRQLVKAAKPTQPTKLRRSGLLSASPGANRAVRKEFSPPLSSTGSAASTKSSASSLPPPTRPVAKPAPHAPTPPRPSASSASPPPFSAAGSSGSPLPSVPAPLKRSKPVDIFMRPNKRPRR